MTEREERQPRMTLTGSNGRPRGGGILRHRISDIFMKRPIGTVEGALRGQPNAPSYILVHFLGNDSLSNSSNSSIKKGSGTT